MVTIRRIESMGHDLSFFRIRQAESEKGTYIYYTFDEGWRLEDMTSWNVIGVRSRNDHSLLLDLQIMYIDEDALAWQPFDARRDADGFIAMHPEDFVIFIEFLESFLQEPLEACHEGSHFALLKKEQLLDFHFNPNFWDSLKDDYYLYNPDEKVQSSNQRSLIGFPTWSSTSGIFQSSSLSFATFDVRRLEESAFDPSDVGGLGHMTFDQCALREFIDLLKQYRYEEKSIEQE